MKRFFLIIVIVITGINVFGQTDGISYQAVILNPNTQELPGADAVGNILPNTEVSIRFTIIDANNNNEYQEIKNTSTDAFGMINLVIGQEDPDAYSLIKWDGTIKNLKVEINFNGSGDDFVDLSRQELNFVPYSYHRNIEAHGTLVVDDATILNSQLTVEGPTNVNSSFAVNNNNNTNLTGALNVGGASVLNDNLDVGGITNLYNSLNVNNLSPTYLTGDLTVGADGSSTFNGSVVFEGPTGFNTLLVGSTSQFNGQVTIDANMDDLGISQDDTIPAYPLIVQGSSQGIAIKVNDDRSTSNNYISFWDSTGSMWGRIEGQTIGDLNSDPEYIVDWASKAVDIGLNSYELISNIAELIIDNSEVAVTIADVRMCVGLGACVTTPSVTKTIVKIAKVIKTIADLVANGVNIALAIADEATFVGFAHANIGVSYQSGAGDYAEWLPKEDPKEEFIVGELVGIKNGFVTKNTFGADKVMVISTNPIVLGNMPQVMDESKYEKIAFMGQVPVRVLGRVQPGDYILPSELGSGFGKAVHPDDMAVRDYKKIVGVAWTIMSQIANDINIVNVAVGINTNDLTNVVANQEEVLKALQVEHTQLKSQMEQSNMVLAELVPGYAESIGYIENSIPVKFIEDVNNQKLIEIPCDDCPDIEEIITIEFSRELVENGIDLAQEDYIKMYKESNQLDGILSLGNIESKAPGGNSVELNDILMPIEEHPFWKRMNSDPDYKEEIIQYIKATIEKSKETYDLSNSPVNYNIEFVDF